MITNNTNKEEVKVEESKPKEEESTPQVKVEAVKRSKRSPQR